MPREGAGFRLAASFLVGNLPAVNIAEMEREMESLPRQEVETLREGSEHHLEDQRQLPPDPAARIDRSEHEMAVGQGRVRNPPPR